ncbi:phytanoyl-CoA dioxygenase family protein [Psychromonas sp. Urea-02u-13]|uniref:phytanoyl-CoA dioxygenase family protein n=1 Tax=Psychromonas sp. Urea-02u-13 TaxID=2058326 RepID=UPI000C3425E1|nr:phytanoyl-CoA dioxygenase family protein [Psychromonas sp. Urea-02u-13]PKG37736.1 phytanoyl-CoA dioxygenase [Psychromonas sp. Urea-02u-13]
MKEVNHKYISEDGEIYILDTPLHKITKKFPLKVLSKEDWKHWKEYGYIVIKNAISSEEAQSTFDFVADFQGIDTNDTSTWYPQKQFASELERDLYVYGFAETYQHQLLWNNRQADRVYQSFVDIWDCEELWVTLDRVNLNPPNRNNRDRALIKATEKGFDISLHWDVDTSLKVLPQRVQGIIALNDSQPEQGGFQCCPELFNKFEFWKKTQPADRDPLRPKIDPNEYPIVIPQLEAGDLLIFNGFLAHGVAANLSESGIRSVQYISMMPALEKNTPLKESRINSWNTLSTPEWNKTLVGDADLHESLRYGPAELNALGKKLLGLDSWN